MQGNPERKPKHRAEFVISDTDAAAAYADDLAKLNAVHATYNDPADDAACNCDPLTDGYANIDCDTHGFPIIPRKGSMGRRE